MSWKDDIACSDFVEASLSKEVVPPAHPCPICKKESKDCGVQGWRVCCAQKFHIGLTEQQHLNLLAEIQEHKDRVVRLNEMYRGADAELTKVLRALSERGITLFPKSDA